MVGHRTVTTRDAAETIALSALAWIAAQDEVFPLFLNATGCAPADLRDRVADPLFLAAVLDFLLADDATILAFAQASGLSPEAPLAARALLPGGGDPHWT